MHVYSIGFITFFYICTCVKKKTTANIACRKSKIHFWSNEETSFLLNEMKTLNILHLLDGRKYSNGDPLQRLSGKFKLSNFWSASTCLPDHGHKKYYGRENGLTVKRKAPKWPVTGFQCEGNLITVMQPNTKVKSCVFPFITGITISVSQLNIVIT